MTDKLVGEIAKQTGHSFLEVDENISLFIEKIGKLIAEGETVCIDGYGVFRLVGREVEFTADEKFISLLGQK